MDNLTPTSLLAIMPNTKGEINNFSEMLLNGINSGEIDPLKIHVQLKAIESVIKKVNDSEDYKKAIRTQSEQYGSKSFTAFGAKVELAETGTKYDFSNCNHTEYNDICNQIKALESNKRDLETTLKTIKVATPFIIYGEAVEVTPPTKSSTSSIKITF